MGNAQRRQFGDRSSGARGRQIEQNARWPVVVPSHPAQAGGKNGVSWRPMRSNGVDDTVASPQEFDVGLMTSGPTLVIDDETKMLRVISEAVNKKRTEQPKTTRSRCSQRTPRVFGRYTPTALLRFAQGARRGPANQPANADGRLF